MISLHRKCLVLHDCSLLNSFLEHRNVKTVNIFKIIILLCTYEQQLPYAIIQIPRLYGIN